MNIRMTKSDKYPEHIRRYGRRWRCLIGALMLALLVVLVSLAVSLALPVLALILFETPNAYVLPILIGVEVFTALLTGAIR